MSKSTNYHELAKAITPEARAFINGRFVAAASGETFDTINPSTGKVIASVALGSEEDVNRAVGAAKASFESGVWANMPPGERKSVLLRWADLIEANLEELAVLETLDCGKPVRDSLAVDIPDTVGTLRWHAEATDKIYDQMSPAPNDVVSMIVREPIGVVGVVIPWNFPLFVGMWKIAPALAGGNSVVVKPAEQTSLTMLRIAGLAAEAGLPDGVFNVVPGLGHVAGRAIGMHMDVDCVSFTGSTEVGRAFLKYSADSNLKKIVLECGGKSPAIVMDDVGDLSPIVENLATGILFCQGENCTASSRLIVHESVKERLFDALVPEFNSWTVGDPLNIDTKIGAMIHAQHLEKVLSYVEAGKAEGAELALGGEQILKDSGGFFIEPTIFDGVNNNMKIAREEIFGPVLSIISFKDAEEAVQIANDTNFGLAASLYTENLNTAHKVAKQLRAGTVSVNCYSEGDYAAPFGGYKESGFGGKDKSLMAHDQYTETKTIWIQLG